MQIQVKAYNDSDNSIYNFLYYYLPNYMYREFINRLNPEKLAIFDRAFKINSFNIIKYALKNLLVTKVRNDTYIVKINGNLVYGTRKVSSYINLITYGTRDIKGYSIILDIFKEVSNNISNIYSAWILGID